MKPTRIIYLSPPPTGYAPNCRIVCPDGLSIWAARHLLDYYPENDILDPNDVEELITKASTHNWLVQYTHP